MATGEISADTTRRLLFRAAVLFVASLVVLSIVASVPIVDSASAGTGDEPVRVSERQESESVATAGGNNSTNATAPVESSALTTTDGNDSATADEGDVFESFTMEIDSGNPERPDDVEIRWNLSANAGHVERVRIEITNESDRPINVYKPNGTGVPNPFTVSEGSARSTDADVVVDDLDRVELVLKVPPGHCDRVDGVEVFASNGSDEALGEPTVQRSLNCTSANGTFAVVIDGYDEEVTAGKNGSVTAEIENTGDARDTQNIRFLVDGEVYERTNLSLSANESETMNFSYTTAESDVGEREVAVESDDDTANRTVLVTAPASFAVTITEAPEAVAAGDPITVTARIRNAGDHNGTQNVTLRNFSNEVVDVGHNLELSPNESNNVTLTWPTDGTDVGVGNLTVSSENDTATAVVEITQPTVESIAVTLDDSELTVAENTSITVEAAYTDGSTRVVTDNATLTSRNATVATVTPNATAIAESEGVAVLEATYGGEADTETLTVDSVDADDSEADDSSGGDSGSGTSNGGPTDDTFSDGEDETATGGSNADTPDSEKTGDSTAPDDTDDSDSDGNGSEPSDDSPGGDDADTGDSAVENADTDAVADSATEESDGTTIVFFPILGLLLFPPLVVATRDSSWGQ